MSEASKVRFVNPYVNGVGLEPAVVASAFVIPENQLSEPVEGENGVFVLNVTSRSVPENPDSRQPISDLNTVCRAGWLMKAIMR